MADNFKQQQDKEKDFNLEKEGEVKVETDNSNQNKKSDDPVRPIDIDFKDPSERMQKEEEIVNELMGWFGQWEAWRKPFEDLWDKVYKLYFQVVENQKTPTRSKIFVPLVFQAIEAAIPKIMTTLFGQEEFFDVVPTNKKEQSLSDVIKLILLYQLGQANFFLKYLEFTKQLLLYGTSYFYVFWKVTRKWVWTRTPIREPMTLFGIKLGNKITGWKEEKAYKVIERRPEIEVLDILDVYPDPEAKDPESGRGLFIRYWKPLDDIKDMGRGKYPVFDPDNVKSDSLKGAQYTYSASRRQRLSARNISDPQMVHKDTIEVLAFWGNYDLDGDGIREEVLIEIGSRKVLLRAQANPFFHQKRPIIKSNFYPVLGEWYGVGLIEPVIPLQHELNTLRRQRLDNINMILNAMWKVNSLADIDLDTLISSPNGIILTDDMTAIDRLSPNNVTDQAYTEAALVQQDIENATAPKSIQGTPQSGSLGRTARGAQLIISQALEKFGMAVKLLEESSVKKILRLFHQLNLQFLDSDEVLREKGMYGHLFDQEVTPEMIRAEVEFKMVGISEMVGKEAKINQLSAFLGLAAKFVDPKSLITVLKEIYKLMGFDDDEINLQGMQMPQPAAPTQVENAIINQSQVNPPGAPPAIPGAPSLGGQ